MPSTNNVARPRNRRFVGVSVVLLIAGSMWGWLYYSWVKPRGHSENIEQLILSLADRRPADVTRGQWGSAVAWTSNLHGNSLLMFETDTSTIAAFENRLREKLAGNVDMQTIHWIWSEYANVCLAGARYQRFKKQMLEEIENVGPDDDIWGMNVP